ncbi:MAG TPA: hypothetical protein VMX56_06175 [Anaerolineales bacterium]|nr:hypothetical protein [Anaerolineales bacterium]
MAICRIISPNRLRDDAACIHETTFNVSEFPAANLLHPNQFKVARSATGGADQSVLIDLGSPKTVQGIGILNHTIPTGPSVLRVSGYEDEWSGWLDLTWNADKIIGFFDTLKTCRYWNLEISASAQFDIGILFLGPFFQPVYEAYTRLNRTEATSEDRKVTYDILQFGFELLTIAEAEELREFWILHRRLWGEGPYQQGSEPGLFCLDSTGVICTNGLQKFSIYGVIVGDFPEVITRFSHIDQLEFEVEECL